MWHDFPFMVLITIVYAKSQLLFRYIFVRTNDRKISSPGKIARKSFEERWPLLWKIWWAYAIFKNSKVNYREKWWKKVWFYSIEAFLYFLNLNLYALTQHSIFRIAIYIIYYYDDINTTTTLMRFYFLEICLKIVCSLFYKMDSFFITEKLIYIIGRICEWSKNELQHEKTIFISVIGSCLRKNWCVAL